MTLILFAQTDGIITIIWDDIFLLLACSEFLFYENAIADCLFSNPQSWERMFQILQGRRQVRLHSKEAEVQGVVQ